MGRRGRVARGPTLGQTFFNNQRHDDDDDDDDNSGIFFFALNRPASSAAVGSRLQLYTASPVGSRLQLYTASPVGSRLQLNTASPVGSRLQLNTASPFGSRTASPFQSRSNLAALNPSNLEEHSSIHKECKKLEASNFRMQVLFYVLVTACVLMLMLYAALIAFLLDVWTAVTDQPRFCVANEKIDEFMNIWTREDEGQIRALMKAGGYVRTYNPGVNDVHCFGNLTWVPKTMGKINMAVQRSLSYIENSQLEISNTADILLTNDQQQQQECLAGKTPGNKEPAFAHYFLDTSAKFKVTGHGNDEIGALKWAVPSDVTKAHIRMDVNATSGVFTIVQAGFYYVYSHVIFSSDVTVGAHHVMMKRKNVTTKLLSSTQIPASYLQGMFQLWQNDTLSVHAAREHISTARNSSTYFGAYLIRTGGDFSPILTP